MYFMFHFSEDILVFLTGQEEIEAMVRSVKDIARDCPSGTPPLVVTPLYAALSHNVQLKVFQSTPPVRQEKTK